MLFDWTALTTAGLAAVFTPAVTKTALATTATIATGLQGSLNDRVYLKFLAPRILRETDLSRQAFLLEMQAHENDSLANYSVDHMLRDVQQYHERGSFMNGVMLIATGSGASTLADRTSLDALDNDKAKIRVSGVLGLALGSTYELVGGMSGIEIEPTTRTAGSAITSLRVTLKETTAFKTTIDAMPAGDAQKHRELVANTARVLLTTNFRGVGSVKVRILKTANPPAYVEVD